MKQTTISYATPPANALECSVSATDQATRRQRLGRQLVRLGMWVAGARSATYHWDHQLPPETAP